MLSFVPDMFHLQGQMKRKRGGQGVKGLEYKTHHNSISTISLTTIFAITTIKNPTTNSTSGTVMSLNFKYSFWTLGLVTTGEWSANGAASDPSDPYRGAEKSYLLETFLGEILQLIFYSG